jgi:chromosome segregation ATPase
MSVKKDFQDLLEKLKVERDEINLKLHLASMEAREEFEGAEEQWQQLKAKASEIADDTKEVSEEFVAGAKIVGEELKEAYRRINKRLSE